MKETNVSDHQVRDQGNELTIRQISQARIQGQHLLGMIDTRHSMNIEDFFNS